MNIRRNYKEEEQNLIELLEHTLDFKRWMFRQTYAASNAANLPSIIYDSEFCRVKFVLESGDQYRGFSYTLSVYYSRQHAPNDNYLMLWNGEECHCWHQVYDALNFLDGLSPQEAVDQLQLHHQWPKAAEPFRELILSNSSEPYFHPEQMAKMHAKIWDYYGQRLFEIFDLRQPKLWEQYVQYIKAYQKIKGIRIIPGYSAPSIDKIC